MRERVTYRGAKNLKLILTLRWQLSALSCGGDRRGEAITAVPASYYLYTSLLPHPQRDGASRILSYFRVRVETITFSIT